MSVDEVAPRRPGFSEGRPIRGADGALWYLPVLDESAWERFPQIAEYLRIAIRPEGDEGFDGDERLSASVAALESAILALLASNYALSPSDLDGLINHRGRVSDALTELQEAVMSTPILNALAMIERDGAPKSELPVYMASVTLGHWPVGWDEHDGIMFDN